MATPANGKWRARLASPSHGHRNIAGVCTQGYRLRHERGESEIARGGQFLVARIARPDEMAAESTRQVLPLRGPRLRWGDLEIDLAAHAATVGGRAVELTAREWAVLEALVLRAGRVVAKPDLEKLVLGKDALDVLYYGIAIALVIGALAAVRWSRSRTHH